MSDRSKRGDGSGTAGDNPPGGEEAQQTPSNARASDGAQRRSQPATFLRRHRLLMLVALALAVRLPLLPLPDLSVGDLTECWLPWMAHGARHGLADLYLSGQPSVNYPPLFLAVLVGLGKLYALLVPSFAYSALQSALIKFPAVAADLAVGALVYAAARRIVRSRSAAPGVRPTRRVMTGNADHGIDGRLDGGRSWT